MFLSLSLSLSLSLFLFSFFLSSGVRVYVYVCARVSFLSRVFFSFDIVRISLEVYTSYLFAAILLIDTCVTEREKEHDVNFFRFPFVAGAKCVFLSIYEEI